MSFDPFAYEAEEARDAERFYVGSDDRPDPSEYQDSLHLTKRLDCGHIVEAGEDSGGMDELDRVTLADVERLLEFKIKTHDCGRYEKRKQAARLWAIGGGPFG